MRQSTLVNEAGVGAESQSGGDHCCNCCKCGQEAGRGNRVGTVPLGSSGAGSGCGTGARGGHGGGRAVLGLGLVLGLVTEVAPAAAIGRGLGYCAAGSRVRRAIIFLQIGIIG